MHYFPASTNPLESDSDDNADENSPQPNQIDAKTTVDMLKKYWQSLKSSVEPRSLTMTSDEREILDRDLDFDLSSMDFISSLILATSYSENFLFFKKTP
jgi:hypothetical protein